MSQHNTTQHNTTQHNNFKVWKSGKNWLYSSTALAITAGAIGLGSTKAKADVASDIQSQIALTSMSNDIVNTPAVASTAPVSAVAKTAATATMSLASTSAVASSVAAPSSAAPTEILSGLQTLMSQVSSANAVSPEAGSSYTAMLQSRLSSYASTSEYASNFSALTNGVSHVASNAALTSEAAGYSSAAEMLTSGFSDLSSAVSAGTVDSYVKAKVSSMAATSSGVAQLSDFVSAMSTYLAAPSTTSYAETVASMAVDKAQALGNQSLVAVFTLWKENASSYTTAGVDALTAAKSALSSQDSALAGQIMQEVGEAYKAAHPAAKTLGAKTLAGATLSSSDAYYSTINPLQALALTALPTLIATIGGVAVGELIATITITAFTAVANVVADVVMLIPNMMPVVDWFFAAVNPIGATAFGGIIGGILFGVGGGMITAGLLGLAAGDSVNNTFVAPALGIDMTNPANVNMISMIDLGVGLGAAVVAGTSAVLGGVAVVGIAEVIAGGTGLGLGALSTIPFLGAILNPIENLIAWVLMQIPGQIAGGIFGAIGGLVGGVAGGMITYALAKTGLLGQLWNFIGGVVNSVLSQTVIDNTVKTGVIALNNATVAYGGTFSPGKLLISATSASGVAIATTAITVKGAINTKVPGTYVYQYSFIDPTSGATVSNSALVTVTAKGAATAGAMSLTAQTNAATATSKATVTVKDLTVSTGSIWTAKSAFVSATDSTGAAVAVSNIQVIGRVDTRTPGVYPVIYSFTDATTGAVVTKTALVTVKAQTQTATATLYQGAVAMA
ncbi:MAG: bacterial Ig-like domain-containing protein [Streptococcaceae bacterium]|jgi:hypothetical protein|nr:bacterial Ig-like domain-containing protein [Streptococcaceae bacterium]